MAGGHATFAGIGFQNEVAAWAATHILVGRPIAEISSDAIPNSIQLESLTPVDDIVLTASCGAVFYINVKSNVGVSLSANSPLSSVVDQFVRQWLAGSASQGEPFKRLSSEDRLVLVVKAQHKTFSAPIATTLSRLRDSRSLQGLATTESETEAFSSLLDNIQRQWAKHSSSPLDDEGLLDFLSIIRVVSIDVSGTTQQALETMLSTVIEDGAEQAITALKEIAQDYGTRRSRGDVRALREALQGKGITLKSPPQYQSDIARLQSLTKKTLEDLAHYGSLRIQDDDGVEKILEIPRACTRAIINAAKEQSFLLIGEPGSGKSGSLQASARALLEDGYQVAVLAVDQLQADTLNALSTVDLQLTNPLLEVFSEWGGGKPSILFIDALDASRGSATDGAIKQLIVGLQKHAPHWRIVASIRKFDLRYGTKYQEIFEGSAVNSSFQDKDFGHVRHLNVPILSEGEIGSLSSQWPHLSCAISASGVGFRQLLNNPFNLFLLSKIFSRSSEQSYVAKTQLDLLQQYWRARVLGDTAADGIKGEKILKAVVSKMKDERRLSIDRDSIPDTLLDDLIRLLKNGILVNPKDGARISFAHHVLFDFVLSKLVLLAQDGESLHQEIVESKDDVLLIAPAAALALQILWDDEDRRESFWSVAIKLAIQKEQGAFARSLPAKTLAQSVSIPADFEILLALLRKSTGPDYEAAISLVTQVYGVLLASIVPGVPRLGDNNDPWCEITDVLSEIAIDRLSWPINVALRTWSESKSITDTQALRIGKASRTLLDYELKRPEFYNESSIVAAIVATIRTSHVAKEETERALRPLLQAERVLRHGHKELFWVAHDFKTLAVGNPMFAADVLIAAFGSPIPSSDEPTQMGDSRIIGITSNKKQDFEGVLYSLNKYIAWFVAEYPDEATCAFYSLLPVLIEREHHTSEETTTETFIGSRHIQLKKDLSCIWWSDSAHHHDQGAALLDGLVEGLKNIASRTPEKLNYLADRLIVGEVPASIVAAFLTAMSAQESPPLDLATQTLASEAVLVSFDTAYLAGELLHKVHPLLSVEQRGLIEQQILKLSDKDDQSRHLGCLSPTHIVEPDLLKLYQEKSEQRAVPENIPPFRMEAGWCGTDDNWWLRSQGVDVDADDTKALLASIAAIERKDLPQLPQERLFALRHKWPDAVALLERLNDDLTIHKSLQDKGRDVIAEMCEDIGDQLLTPEALSHFPSLREVISFCLLPNLTPPAVSNDEREKSFSESATWGRPAPRIGAARALLKYIRSKQEPTPEDIQLVLALARDPAVEVRYAILSHANTVCQASPSLAQQLADIGFSEEQNRTVQLAFLNSFRNYMGDNFSWAGEKILALEEAYSLEPSDKHDYFCDQLVDLILRLWMTWKSDEAKNRLFVWTAESLRFRTRISPLILDLRSLVLIEDKEPNSSNAASEIARQQGKELFTAIIENLAASHRDLLERAQSGENVSSDLTECTRLLDSAAHQVYFGSRAYDMERENLSSDAIDSQLKQRFLDDYLPVLKILANIPYPSITHPVLETLEAYISDDPARTLELLIEAVTGGGKPGGYTFESLGADLVVKLVRRFLADYPAVIASNPQYRHGVVLMLDQFAAVGWPEARKLVYELPEMLR